MQKATAAEWAMMSAVTRPYVCGMVPPRAEYESSPASRARTAAMMARQGRARFLTFAIWMARSCCRFSRRSTGAILPGPGMRDPGGPLGPRDHGTFRRGTWWSDPRAEDRLADGHRQPAAHPVGDTGRRGVPGGQRGDDADVAADLDDVGVAAEVPDEQDDLGELQGEEYSEHGRVHLRAPDQHVGVEDRERQQDPTDVVTGRRGGGGLRGHQQCPEPRPDPDPAVSREGGGAEHVPVLELPHPGEQLAEAAVGERVAEPCVTGGVLHPACVGRRKQERGQRESGQPEGRWVGYGG